MTKKGRKVQYWITFAVSLSFGSVGCLVSWAAPVIPKFQANETDIDITKDEISWLIAMVAPGLLIGSLATRYISDRLGRRATLLWSALPVVIGTVTVVFAKNVWLLYFIKFLWGAGAGMINTVAFFYIAEISDKEIRGKLTLGVRLMFNFGNLLVMSIGPLVSYDTLNYMMNALPVIFFGACWWIPESPYYYLKEGKVEEATKVIISIRGYEDEKELEDELEQMKNQVSFETRRSGTLKELFISKQHRKAVIIATVLKYAQIFSGTLVIRQYLGVILKESKIELSIPAAFIIFGVVNFIAGIISSFSADIAGRRPLLIYSFIGNAVCLMYVGVYYILLDFSSMGKDTLQICGNIAFTLIIVASVISSIGYSSICQLVPAEIFALNVKAVANTTLSIWGGVLTFASSRGYQIVEDIAGLAGVFWFFAITSVLGAVFSAYYVPETKGKSLREIQMQLQGDLYEDDSAKAPDQIVTSESKELQELITKSDREKKVDSN